MTTTSHTAKDIFVELVGNVSPDCWDERLVSVCAGDIELCHRVRALLSAHADPGSFLDQPIIAVAAAASDDPPIAERPGTIIGPYKLLEQIGEGGFGVVFMAEQTQPIQRKVALKIVKPGMDSKQVLARFDAERQALAMMDHPNIAKVLDAGTTESGRPYFVMELVRGVPLTDYCDHHQLSVRDRLGLFVAICQAVQHAHQKGIIHRDLKPTNVLVTQHDGRPMVKVIDFGVAKAIDQKLTEKTLFTGFAQLIGTPLYMSPEQAEMTGLDVDTRSDIYSLGVLLYELLTGSTPFESERLKSAAFDEMRRIIREEEPPRPSTRLSTLAQQAISTVSANRASDPRQLSRFFQGELDWIVMKALEKERNRRYETASAMAADVEHYLRNEPVLACPPSVLYRFRKFARRYQASIAFAAAIAGLLVLGSVISLWQAIRATNAEQKANASERNAVENARRTGAVASFLLHSFQSLNLQTNERALTVAELLDRTTNDLKNRFANDPCTKAAILQAIGKSYHGLNLYDAAVPLFVEAYQLRVGTLGPDDPDTLDSMNDLAVEYWASDRTIDALPVAEELVQRRTAILGPESPDTLRPQIILAIAYSEAGRIDEARRLFERTLKLQRTTLGASHSDTIRSMIRLAQFYYDIRSYDNATALLEEAVKLEKDRSKYDFYALLAIDLLGQLYLKAGRYDDAIPLFEESLTKRRTVFGPTHEGTLIGIVGLATAYRQAGRQEEAALLCDEAVNLSNSKLGLQHHWTVGALNRLATLLSQMSRYSEAEVALREAVRIKPDSDSALFLLASLFVNCPQIEYRNTPRAIEIANELIEIKPQSDVAWKLLGQAQYRAGNWQACIDSLSKSNRLQNDPAGGDSRQWFFLAMTHWQVGHKEEAHRWYEQAVEWMEKHEPCSAELLQFRTEAEALLKGDETSPKNEKHSPQPDAIPSASEKSATSGTFRGRQQIRRIFFIFQDFASSRPP